MKTEPKPFTPCPVGTVRGPFECGPYRGLAQNPSVQFAVYEGDGFWKYFIRSHGDDTSEKQLEQQAREYAATLTK